MGEGFKWGCVGGEGTRRRRGGRRKEGGGVEVDEAGIGSVFE